MVLQRGQNNLVTGLDELAAVAVHHQVDGLGGAAGEDHFALVGRVDETLQLDARFLIGGGRPFRQGVHRPVDVGVLRGLVAHQAVYDGLRHLAGGRVVQVDQRLAFDLGMQDGKVGAYLFDIKDRRDVDWLGARVHGWLPVCASMRCCS